MPRPKGAIRGSAMGVVLMVAAIALLAAFTAAAVSTMGLRVSSRVSNAAAAHSLADSVVAEAAARLQLDLGFQHKAFCRVLQLIERDWTRPTGHLYP